MALASQWSFGPFRLDVANACLWRDDQMIALRPKAFAVLTHLVAHAGQLVTKDELLDAVWPEAAVSDAVLKACIGQLRKAFGETAQASQFIVTVHRRGYRFVAPVMAVVQPELECAAPLSLSSGVETVVPQPSFLTRPSALLVAREAELSQLRQWLTTALQNERQVGLITGEAGIGKTALVDAFVSQLEGDDDFWVGHGQCIEQYGAGEAYLPLLEAVGQLCHTFDGTRVIEILYQQAPSWLLQMPALLSAADYAVLQRRSSEATRERMMRELAEAMETLSAERPIVLVLEDLHWSDVSSLNWLGYVARRRGAARLLVLGTYRPVDAIVRAHPLRAIAQELRRQPQCVELALGYLTVTEVAAYLERRFEAASLPDDLIRLIHQRTNGNPLFMVNVVDDIVRQGILQNVPDGWMRLGELEAVAVGVPENLRHLIERQLEELNPEEQDILEVASVVGVEFSAAAIAAGIDHPVEDVETWCEALARRGQFIRSRGIAEWPDGTVAARYGFIHALYQAILYERIPASRQARWHQQIGMRQELGYGLRAREVAAELAAHFTRGRDALRAAQYLWYAGENALQRSAHQEAIAHLTHALELHPTLPNTPERVQQELAVQLALGSALIATKGYATAEVERVYSRARQLCQGLGETPQLFSALVGLRRFYQVRAAYPTARDLGEQLLTMAERRQEPAWLLEAHFGVGITLYYLGDFATSHTHCEQGIALYDVLRNGTHAWAALQDPGVVCHTYAALGLWALGDAEQAVYQSQAGLALARELAHPYSLAFALLHSAMLHVQRREGLAAAAMAEEALIFAQEQGFAFWMAWGTVLRGAALAVQGKSEEGIAHMQQGLDAAQHTEAGVGRSMFLTLLAEAYGQAGQPATGLRIVNEARAIVHRNGERCYEAETCRIKGELLLTLPEADDAEAEMCLQHALEVARRQQAKAWALRAAMSLSRLWMQQDKQPEARQLMAEVYGGLTEGFDTVDLQEAQAHLRQLGDQVGGNDIDRVTAS